MDFQQASIKRYSHCDSYFVESQEDGAYVAMADARERARMIAREQQRALGAELSKMTSEEYQEDILDHMEHMESETLPDVSSIDIQTEIQWFMRPYLLDFLIEAHAAFSLLPETLFLTINILDRYCSRRVVYKRHYQLVGCAALLIAAKYGDKKEHVPMVHELRSMCCSLYEDDMFTQMEWHVLQTLNWVIGHPTIDSFLQIALSEGPDDHEVEHMAWYICEIAMFHREFISIRPSVMARSALALARCILARSQPRLSDWAGRYDSMVVIGLSQHLTRPSTVLSKKYSSVHLSSVSISIEAFLQRQAQMARRNASAVYTEMVPMDESESISNSFAPPHTPQKGPFESVMPNGYLTPPITPDNDLFGAAGFGKNNSIVPRPWPETPSTPSSMQQQQTLEYSHSHMLPQYVQ